MSKLHATVSMLAFASPFISFFFSFKQTNPSPPQPTNPQKKKKPYPKNEFLHTPLRMYLVKKKLSDYVFKEYST